MLERIFNKGIEALQQLGRGKGKRRCITPLGLTEHTGRTGTIRYVATGNQDVTPMPSWLPHVLHEVQASGE